jgi:hypothetical protein
MISTHLELGWPHGLHHRLHIAHHLLLRGGGWEGGSSRLPPPGPLQQLLQLAQPGG